MSVRIEPSILGLRRAAPRLVHDVGEIAEIQTAQATLLVTVFAEDAITGLPLAGVVHLDAVHAPTNRAFQHTFSAEFDEEMGLWRKERLWVESDEYESVDIDYSVAVD